MSVHQLIEKEDKIIVSRASSVTCSENGAHIMCISPQGYTPLFVVRGQLGSALLSILQRMEVSAIWRYCMAFPIGVLMSASFLNRSVRYLVIEVSKSSSIY